MSLAMLASDPREFPTALRLGEAEEETATTIPPSWPGMNGRWSELALEKRHRGYTGQRFTPSKAGRHCWASRYLAGGGGQRKAELCPDVRAHARLRVNSPNGLQEHCERLKPYRTSRKPRRV